MSTSRSSGNPDCIADLGAQYITVTPEYAIKHKEIHQDLIDSNVIKPLDARVEGLKSKDGTTDYVTSVAGMSSIVKHFFKKSGMAVNFSHHINHISITSDNKIQVSTQVFSDLFYFVTFSIMQISLYYRMEKMRLLILH